MEPLEKTITGITGLDEILNGGLPKGRPTLLFGGPGCGKTALAMEFVCRGAQQFDEAGLFVSFEETSEELKTNFASFGFGFSEAMETESVHIESILMNAEFSVEVGEFTLDGLLVRLEHSVNRTGARRLALDSLSSLFSQFSDTANLRHEISRIFQWIKKRGLTAIVTSELEGIQPARYALEEYVSDCVIHMDHTVREQVSKRRLRVVKYRGSSHGTDEYPFLITENGIFLLPITSVGLDSVAPNEFISTGVDGLDQMFGGKGYYRGSTVLISGCAGTGKSTLAMCFALSTCRGGGKSLYLAFEESANQIQRNMRSVGIDVDPEIENGRMRIEPIRPSAFGLEEHMVRMISIIDKVRPDTVVMDPISSFTSIGQRIEIRALYTRTLDYLKREGINTLLVNLTPGSGTDEETEAAVSSIVDTWVIIRFERTYGRRQRQIYVHKARGIGHSHDLGELIFSDTGVTVKPIVFHKGTGGEPCPKS
jgi:circadian clock protein KaiC